MLTSKTPKQYPEIATMKDTANEKITFSSDIKSAIHKSKPAISGLAIKTANWNKYATKKLKKER